MNSTSTPINLEASALTAGDVLEKFLAEKQSPATRRAYAVDLRDFFGGERPAAGSCSRPASSP